MTRTAERLDRYLDAEATILRGQTVQLEGLGRVGLADLGAVQAQITQLRRQLAAEQARRNKRRNLFAGAGLADFSGGPYGR